MGVLGPQVPGQTSPGKIERLDSWKEIAAYLKRSLRTVQRWEKHEGLPVHRHTHEKLGSVYAYPAELDVWWTARLPRMEAVQPATIPGTPAEGHGRWLWLGIPAIALSVAVALLSVGRVPPQPFERFTLTRLTSTGATSSAAISADGKYLAYVLGDRGQQSMRLRDLETGNDIQILPPSVAVYGAISFSAGAGALYYNATGADNSAATLYRIPLPRGSPEKIKERLNSPAALSPDGNYLAFVREEGSKSVLLVAGLNGSGERKLAASEFPGFLDYPAWSPDGAKIACTSVAPGITSVQILEVDVATGASRPLSSRKWPFAKQLKWLGHGKGLLLSARQNPGALFSLWHLSYPSGTARKITGDLDEFGTVSITADSAKVVTIHDKLVSSLWLSPASEVRRARQVAFDTSRFSQASLAPDSAIFLEKQEGGRRGIWLVQPDANTQKRLTTEGNNYDPSVCHTGPYLVYTCENGGLKSVCRMKQDGSGQQRLTPGATDDAAARCSPDGRSIVYTASKNGNGPMAWKISMEGGTPEQLTDKLCARPAISPDGRWIACFYAQSPSAQADPDTIAVISIAGGAPAKVFPLPLTAYIRGGLRWTPDGTALAYVDNRGGVSNIWLQPLEGAPRPFTAFGGDRIFYFEWSPDGRQLAFSSGTRSQDAFLIRDQR